VLETILVVAAVVNVVAFGAFGVDKWLARRNGRRIPEAWLLSLAFATGLGGAWLGMNVFRHKTRKTSFRVKMVLVSVFNLAWPLLYIEFRVG
jgi:uncharacterized membrane protein YsdA (DUF1294 family)